MKLLALKKKIRSVNNNRLVGLHPNQLEVAGLKVGDEVLIYVKGKKIIIEKVEI